MLIIHPAIVGPHFHKNTFSDNAEDFAGTVQGGEGEDGPGEEDVGDDSLAEIFLAP